MAIALKANDIVGFAAGGPCRDCLPGFGAELYAIYLLRRAQGQGAGRCLFEVVRDGLAARGFDDLMLWVLTDNRGARGFYERQGDRLVANE